MKTEEEIHSSSLLLCPARNSCTEARVGMEALHSGVSTLFRVRRIFALWSSGDHFNGAAAWALPPHWGHVISRHHAWQTVHCWRSWRAI